MPEESVKKRRFSVRKLAVWLVVLLAVPAVLLISWRFGDRKYYLCSMLLLICAMVPFFLRFEKRRPQAREMVTLAVMCALAVASRAAFAIVPFFKPMAALIMITGMAFGAEAGFLTGAVGAFASNFIFGQGPWTPWQMFAYGMAGFLAGLFGRLGVIGEEKRAATCVFGGVSILTVVGPLLDTCMLFTMSEGVNAASAKAVYLSGIPANVIHAAATVLTLLILGKPILEKLDRIKIKYGLMDGEQDEL